MRNFKGIFCLTFVFLIFKCNSLKASPQGLRAVLIYTIDDSIIGADIKTQEVNAEVFKEISNMKEISRPISLASSFELLNFLYDRCDVQLKCAVKPNEPGCDKCFTKTMKPCIETTTTSKSTTSRTTPITTASTSKFTESTTTESKVYLPPDNKTTIVTQAVTKTTPSTTKPLKTSKITTETTTSSKLTTPSSTVPSTISRTTTKSTTSRTAPFKTSSISTTSETTSKSATTKSTTSKTTKTVFVGPEYLPVSRPSIRPTYTPWTGTYRPYTGTFKQYFTFKPATVYQGTWKTRQYTPGTFTSPPHYQYTAPLNSSENNDKQFI